MSATFTNDADGVKLVDHSRQNVYNDRGLRVDQWRSEISFNEFFSLPPADYYWSLPEKFLGNKVELLLDFMLVFGFDEMLIWLDGLWQLQGKPISHCSCNE